MVKVTVCGKYRCDKGHEHGEPILKNYTEIFTVEEGLPNGEILIKVENSLKIKDVAFDSLKTHFIKREAIAVKSKIEDIK